MGAKQAWSLALREEHRLRVFEKRVLRRIFGPKRDEVMGDWRKLHNDELHNLYSSPNIIRMIKSRRMRWAEHVARMGEMRNAYEILGGKSEGKRPLGRPRHMWVDNIKMDLREIGWVALNVGHSVGGIFCGLKKPFDCVNHKILLSKLQFYGVFGPMHKLIASYLRGRFQRIKLQDNDCNLNTYSN
jgi:hypothetical protein